MNGKLRVILILLNAPLVLDSLLYYLGKGSFAGPHIAPISGALAIIGLILAIANKAMAKWLTLAAALIALVGALAF